LIASVIEALDNNKAVLPAVAVNDTIKRVENGRSLGTVDRETLFQAQTPQGFVFNEIYNAHKRADAEKEYVFTDDASVAEWDNLNVIIVEGLSSNFKITTAQDIEREIGRASCRERV